MTTDLKPHIRASRVRVARSRGALSGLLLILLGAWAALIPFIGPYFNFAFTPDPNTSWHWTTERGVFEVLPGAAAALGGLLLLVSANRVMASFGGWLAAASGAWLIVGPSLARSAGFTHLGGPDPSSRSGVQTLEQLLFFFAIGAAILFLAALGLGRLSVHSVRDVRAAEKRAAAEEAAAAAAAAEAERLQAERAQAERAHAERVEAERAHGPQGEPTPGDRVPADRAEADRAEADRGQTDRPQGEGAPAQPSAGYQSAPAQQGAPVQPGGPVHQAPPGQQAPQYAPGQPTYQAPQGPPPPADQGPRHTA